MSKLKVDTGSLTSAMQKNPDFIPTLVSSLTALQESNAVQPSAALQAPDEKLTNNVSASLLNPSELRESVEAERRAQMITDALS